MKKSMILMVMAIFTMILIAGCGKEEEKAPMTSLDKIKAAGVIKVGTSPDYPPFEGVDENGNIVGFDIDLSKEIATELGVKAEFVRMGFDTIITAVKNGQVDLGMSSFSVNEERKQSIDFTIPYISSAQVILVKKDATIMTKEDLNGAVVASQMGTTGAEAAKAIENAEVKVVDDYNIATMMLENGTVSAVVLDIAIGSELASRQDFRILEIPLNKEETAGVIKKENDQLRAEIDKALEKIKADGRYDKIKAAWKVK